MIRKILVPTDYSEASLNALETAIEIAANSAASIQILHVADECHSTSDSYPPEIAQTICDAMAGKISISRNIRCEIIFAKGYAGPAIIKCAMQTKTDLIIMGKHGSSGSREDFIGSTSYYVIKSSCCPVLIIPEGNKWTEFGKVLFPFNIEPGTVVPIDIIKYFDNAIIRTPIFEFISISTENSGKEAAEIEAFIALLQSKYDARSIRLSVSIRSEKNIAEQVLEKVIVSQADLLIVSQSIEYNNRRSSVGPLSQQIINHSRIPVLSMVGNGN